MITKFLFILFFLLYSLHAQTQLDVQKFRIYPSSVTQTEPVATVHPIDTQMLFVSAVTFNTSSAFRSEGVYVSTNSGADWFGNDTCTGALIYNHGGDPGIVITESDRFVLTHIGDLFSGIYSHYSTNLGTSWFDAVTVTNKQTSDKGTITLDVSNTSTYKGRIHLAWTDVVSPFSCVSSFSTNDGMTWSAPKIVNPNPVLRCVGGSVTTASNGTVYICWSGITPSLPFREDFAGLAISTDGGELWSSQQNIFDMNGVSGTLPSKGGIRVNGLPQIAIDKSGGTREGWIYIVTTEFDISPAGSDPDLILHRSTDGGSSWSPGIRINKDPINNGKIQYFPALEIDEEGGLNILFYDDRNTTSDSTDVFLTRSVDGGNTWAEYQIKNSRFKPKPILGGASAYQGDHIALLSVADKLYAFWMADYSGIYQVWCSSIDLNILSVDENEKLPVINFSLFQNFPNPFNSITKISWQAPVSGWQTLKVYDILGNEVATLVDEYNTSGKYETTFNGTGLPSGIYFYKFTAGAFSQTKKLILLK